MSAAVAALAAVLVAHAAAVIHTPRFKWAERVDRVFITVAVPDAQGAEVAFRDEGGLRVASTSGKDGLQYVLDIELFGPIEGSKSSWFKHRDTIDVTLAKAGRPARWFQLLKGQKSHPQMGVDWGKYEDYDDELDALEAKSGARGVPVPPRERELKAAVDEYWQRKRVEDRERGDMPSLDAVTKRAEEEWVKGGKKGSFQDIVSRIWQEDMELKKRERQLEEEEDRWAGWSGGPPKKAAAGAGGADRGAAAETGAAASVGDRTEL